jgi:hypothetical protein
MFETTAERLGPERPNRYAFWCVLRPSPGTTWSRSATLSGRRLVERSGSNTLLDLPQLAAEVVAHACGQRGAALAEVVGHLLQDRLRLGPGEPGEDRQAGLVLGPAERAHLRGEEDLVPAHHPEGRGEAFLALPRP